MRMRRRVGGSYSPAYGPAPGQHPKKKKTKKQQQNEDRYAGDVASAIQNGHYNWNEHKITATPAGFNYSGFNGK